MVCCGCVLLALALAIAVAAYFSPAARYHVKMFTFAIGSIIFATTPIPLFIMRPRDYRNALVPAWGCRWLLRMLGVTFEIRGLENIHRESGCVVAMNHQSAIDLGILAYLWPVIGRATVVAKKELLYAFPFGLASYLWGTLFIDRTNRTDSVNKLNKESRAIQKNAAKLLFFPEGTRHLGERLLPFKKGAFHIAVQSESAIQPVVTSRYWFMDRKRHVFGTGHCIIQILPEISCKGLSKDDIPALIEKTQQLMQSEYEKLNAETCPKHDAKRD